MHLPSPLSQNLENKSKEEEKREAKQKKRKRPLSSPPKVKLKQSANQPTSEQAKLSTNLSLGIVCIVRIVCTRGLSRESLERWICMCACMVWYGLLVCLITCF